MVIMMMVMMVISLPPPPPSRLCRCRHRYRHRRRRRRRAPPLACSIARSVYEPGRKLRADHAKYVAETGRAVKKAPPSQPGAVSAQIHIRLLRPGRAEGRYLLDRLYKKMNDIFGILRNFWTRNMCFLCKNIYLKILPDLDLILK